VTKDAYGWIGEISEGPDDGSADREVVFYCPACAEREFDIATRATSYN
jgi:hypothetical protein